MKADYVHYQLHWEFFKSVNPKADELFFVELQIEELIERLEKERKEIDFSNDDTKTLKGYLNNEKRINFFFHKEYLEYLETRKIELLKIQNNKFLSPQPISVNESRTKKIIFETFASIDKQGWQYAFVSERDYNLFADLLTNFFEYKPYTLPETTIQLKRTCKTKVAKALGDIHKELSNENKLSTDTQYFQLIRILSHFKNETEGDLYKALTR